ncbi:MAG: FecR domain-containing protein [Marinoscillum sp.]
MADNEKHIIKWLNGDISTEELRSQIGDDALKYAQINQEVEKWEPIRSEEFLTSVDKIIQGETKTITRSINWWKPLSIAASVALLLSLSIWLWIQPDSTTYYAEAGETKEILLPDGLSVVTLASMSSLKLDEELWSEGNREVALTGKALFSVEPGNPFSVHTKSGEVTVLGTTFTVDELGGSFHVACYEGKVRATVSNVSQLVVGGESYLYTEGKWEDKIEISLNSPSWLNNESSFTNAPLKQVIETIEKQFEVDIVEGKTNMDRRFTGSFPNDDLKSALKIVFTSLEIEYKTEKNEIYLSE